MQGSSRASHEVARLWKTSNAPSGCNGDKKTVVTRGGPMCLLLRNPLAHRQAEEMHTFHFAT